MRFFLALPDTYRNPNGDESITNSVDDDMEGAWNVYVGLPSGKVLISDMIYGLFVVTVDDDTISPTTSSPTDKLTRPSSNKPSTVPSNKPSTVPSNKPTTVPSIKPSSSPSTLPSILPSLLSTLLPSDVLSNNPSSPTTFSPTTSSPTTSCVDLKVSGVKFTYKRYSNALIYKKDKTGKKCKHLAEEKDITIKKNCADENLITEGYNMANYCKLTCDNCDNPTASPTTCGDLKVSGVKFTYKRYTSAGIYKKDKKRKKCKHLAEEKDITIKKNCADEINIADYCKLTCDNCGDDSSV